jgi:hypothetical protein
MITLVLAILQFDEPIAHARYSSNNLKLAWPTWKWKFNICLDRFWRSLLSCQARESRSFRISFWTNNSSCSWSSRLIKKCIQILMQIKHNVVNLEFWTKCLEQKRTDRRKSIDWNYGTFWTMATSHHNLLIDRQLFLCHQCFKWVVLCTQFGLLVRSTGRLQGQWGSIQSDLIVKD